MNLLKEINYKSSILAIALLVFLLYGNSIFNKYNLDDYLVTNTNSQVLQGIKSIPSIFSSYHLNEIDGSFEYRPFAKATFAIEYQFFGINPLISHLINVFLYAITCILIFILTIKIFPNQSVLFGFTVTILFAIHPVHTEVVCSLKNRDEIFSFLFALLSAFSFIKFYGKNNGLFFIMGILFFFIALISKITCLPFILITPLILFYVFKKDHKKTFFVFLGLGIVTFLYFYTLLHYLPNAYNREVFFIENPVSRDATWNIILLNGIQTLWFYLKLMIYPHPLSFYYGFNMLPVPEKISPEIIISFLFHSGVALFAIITLVKRNLMAFGIFFYLFCMSMYANIVFPAPGIVAERSLYASSFGFSVVLSMIIFTITKVETSLKHPKKNISFIALLSGLVCLGGIKTFNRNADWYDSYTLMKKDVAHLTQSARANMGFASVVKDLWETENDSTRKKELALESITYFQKALKVKEDMAIPYNEMGELFFNQFQEYEKANKYFEKACSLLNNRPKYLFNYATSFVFTGIYDKAEKYFLKTISLDSTYDMAYHNLFLIYVQQGRLDEAFEINNHLEKLTPRHENPYINFGNYYLARKDTISAIDYFEKAHSLIPHNKQILDVLISLTAVSNQEAKREYYSKKLEEINRK